MPSRVRRSGDEALGLPARSPALRDEGRAETFNDQLLNWQPRKRLHLQEARLPITLKDRILAGSLSACPDRNRDE